MEKLYWFLWRRKHRGGKDLDLERLRLQLEMVELLNANGYSWDQIFHAIGFSKDWLNFTRMLLAKHNKK